MLLIFSGTARRTFLEWVVARVFIGILQNIFCRWAIIFSPKSKGRILDKLRFLWNMKRQIKSKNTLRNV